MLSKTKAFYKSEIVPDSIDSFRFVGFASKIDGIMSQFLTTGQMMNFRVNVEDSSSAYIDFETNKIVLPKWYVSEEALTKLVPDENPVDVALALINGSAAHESLHGKWTQIEKSYEAWLNKFFSSEIKTFGQDFVGTIINICEDIYIEAREGNPYQIFTDAKNSILFREFKIDTITNTICQFKNKELRSEIEEVLTEEQFDILQKFVDMRNEVGASSRVNDFREAIRIFGETKDAEDELEKIAGGEGDAEGDGDGSDGDEGQPKMTGGSSMETEGASIAKDDSKAAMVANALEGEVQNNQASSLSKKSSIDGFKVGTVLEVDVDDMKCSPENLDAPETDSSFIQALRAVRHKNTTKGEPMQRGSQINASQLYRISTDQKVFAEPHRYDAKAEQIEIGMLIDASGSMSGYLFPKVVSEVMEFSNAMLKSRIPHFVNAHTSVAISGVRNDTPVLISVIKSKIKGMTVDRLAKMQRLMGISLRQNYDGFMIEKSLEYFSNRETRKILLVLSDGEPYAPSYRGCSATSHTKKKIAEARAKGYIVISISLVRDVVGSNNDIYGKDWNVDASENMVAQIQSIITKVSRR